MILPPSDEADVGRFLREVETHPDFIEVQDRLEGYLKNPDEPERLMYWSVDQYRNAQGRWTPRRRQLHRQIVAHLLDHDTRARPGSRPQGILLIGPPGAGKTQVGVPLASAMGVEFTALNADDIKVLLPEYQGWNAALVHEESSWLIEELVFFISLMQNRNVLLDLTGTNQTKIGEMATDMSADGYDVHVLFVDLPAWKSMARAWDRFQKNPFNRVPGREMGRFVPPDYVYNVVDGKPALTYEYLKALPCIKSWRRFSTDVPLGSDPVLLDEGTR